MTWTIPDTNGKIGKISLTEKGIFVTCGNSASKCTARVEFN
jgi:hypothetical protein